MSTSREYIRIFWSGYLDFPEGNYVGGTKDGQPMTGEFNPKLIDLQSVSNIDYSIDSGKIGAPTLTDFSFTIKNRANDDGSVLFGIEDIVNIGRTKEYGGRSIRRSDIFIKAYSNILGKELFTGYIKDFKFTKRQFEINFSCESIFKLTKDETVMMKSFRTGGGTVGDVSNDTIGIASRILPIPLPQPNGQQAYKGVRDLIGEELNFQTVKLYLPNDSATRNLDAPIVIDIIDVLSESDLISADLALESTLDNIGSLIGANRPTFNYTNTIGKLWSPRFRRWALAYIIKEKKDRLFDFGLSGDFDARFGDSDLLLRRMIEQDLRVDKYIEATGKKYGVSIDKFPYNTNSDDLAIEFINSNDTGLPLPPFVNPGAFNETVTGFEYAGKWRTGYLKIDEDIILTTYRHVYVSEERTGGSTNGLFSRQISRIVGGIEFVHARNGDATFEGGASISSSAKFDVLYERGRFLVGSKEEPLDAGSVVELSIIDTNANYDYDVGTELVPDVQRLIASDEDRTIAWDGAFVNSTGDTLDYRRLIGSDWAVIHGVRFKRVIDGNSIYLQPSSSDENKDILIDTFRTLDTAVSKYIKDNFFFDTSSSAVYKTLVPIKQDMPRRYRLAFISDIRHFYWVDKKIEEAITDLAFQQSLYVSQAPNGAFRVNPRWYVNTLMPNGVIDPDFVEVKRKDIGDDKGDDISFGFDAFRISISDVLEINNLIGDTEATLKINERGLVQNQFTNIDTFEPVNYRTTKLGVPTREGIIVGTNQKILREGIASFTDIDISEFVSDPITQSREFIKSLVYPTRIKKTGFNFLGKGLFNPVTFDVGTGSVIDDVNNRIISVDLESDYKNIEVGWYVYVKKTASIFEVFLVQSLSFSVSDIVNAKVFMALELMYVGDISSSAWLIDEFNEVILDEANQQILDETG